MSRFSPFSSIRVDLEHLARDMEMVDLDENMAESERFERLSDSAEELAELLERARQAMAR